MLKFQYQNGKKMKMGENNIWVSDWGNKGIANWGRFQILQIVVKGVTNRSSLQKAKRIT